ncbi:MAG: sarcosine oxidase [Gammaproteobacteria bacterium]|nr:sarcosine oxidase [Gammaproteobacteria bacterium]
MTQQADPTSFNIRSPHYRTLLSAGARFGSYMNTSCVMDYGRSRNWEVSQAKQLGLVDLTPIPRTGFKGQGVIQWISSQGMEIGQHSNKAYPQQNGMLVGRLADIEVIILNGLQSRTNQCESLDEKHACDQPVRCYLVPRFNTLAWFMVTGETSAEVFAKICGVDLRLKNFSRGAIAQTSVARINSIIIRHDLKEIPAFHLLFDSASTEYMWACLMDAYMEFKGSPVGYSAIRALVM